MIRYLSKEEIIETHRYLIEEFGGSHGLKDEGALEAALFRPQCGYYEDIVEQAAAMMESLAVNHSFVDGNKRTAFFASDTFLRWNGYFIDVDGKVAYNHLMGLFEKHQFNCETLDKWIRQNLIEV